MSYYSSESICKDIKNFINSPPVQEGSCQSLIAQLLIY
jgi:hypothetical protein